MWTKLYWLDVLERALKSAAQFVVLVWIGGAAVGAATSEQAQAVNAFATDWLNLLGVFAGGAILSVLTSLASGARTGTASATHRVEYTRPADADYTPRHAAR